MRNGRDDETPLDSLRVVAAVVRSGSFSAAAAALGVQQPAVSRRVGAVEEWLGVPLFERGGGPARPTPPAKQLAAATDRHLGAIEAVCKDIRGHAKQPTVVIDTTIGLAVGWLLPRLGDLRASHPDLCVELTIRDVVGSPADHRSADLAITFGEKPATTETTVLFGDTFFAVCSLAYRRSHGPISVDTITAHRLLHLRQGWAVGEWETLLTPQGLAVPAPEPAAVFDSYMGFVHAVLACEGIGIGWDPVFNEHIERGDLELALDVLGHSARGYWLTATARAADREAVHQVQDWLLDQALRTPVRGTEACQAPC